MVGLHYLKHAFDESDESVVARWIENPHWGAVEKASITKITPCFSLKNEADFSFCIVFQQPHWQYFCGYKYMQHDCPIHPTSMVTLRQRVGIERLEALLAETI